MHRMLIKPIAAFISVLLLMPVFLSMTAPLFASEVTGVTLQSIKATETDDGKVKITWITSTEPEALGFYLKRVTGSDSFSPVTNNHDPDTDRDVIILHYEGSKDTYIEAKGNVGAGATYVAIDNDVADGKTYYYMLIQLEFTGRVTEAGTIGEHITRITVGGNANSDTMIYLPLLTN